MTSYYDSAAKKKKKTQKGARKTSVALSAAGSQKECSVLPHAYQLPTPCWQGAPDRWVSSKRFRVLKEVGKNLTPVGGEGPQDRVGLGLHSL